MCFFFFFFFEETVVLIRIYKYKLEINAFIIFIAYKYIIKVSQPNHAASNLTCTWLWTNCDLYQLPWPYVKAQFGSTFCCVLRFKLLRFFFFFFCFHTLLEECGYCSMNSSRKCWLFSVNSTFVHCLRTHKFHFLSIFSLKMGPTVLFTHLKIILLQWFQQ